MHTPWGTSQTVETVGKDGILLVTTAGHGGFKVPVKLLSRIPKKYQDYAEKWSGSREWYEEDVAAAIVIVCFPELFNGGQLEIAKHIISNYIDKDNA